MKRIIALILCLLMLLNVFCSCEKKNEDGKADTSETQKSSIPDGSANDAPGDVISFESEHYKVDNNMLNYFYRFDYYEAIEKYYDSYFQYYNLNPKKDLKQQQCKLYEENKTWFDYFIAMTTSNIVNFLYFAERAYDVGNNTAPEITENVEKDLEAIKSAAEYYEISKEEFIKSRFGATVTEEDVRRALELYYTGTYQYDLDLASIKVSDEDMDKYYEENKSEFVYCDFRSYSIKANVKDGASEAETLAAYEKAEKKAKELLATGNEQAFISWIYNYEKEINDTLETPLTEQEMQYYSKKITVEYNYTDKTAFGKWAFEEGRKVGDMTMLDNGQGTYTVYYIYTAPTRHNNKTANISRILVDIEDFDNNQDKAYEKAKELWEKWENTDKSLDAFNKLAKEYNSEDNIEYDGLKTSDMETQLSSWCTDTERKAGDSELIPSSYGYYIVYYRGSGEIQWKSEAYEAIRENAIKDIYNEYIDKYSVSLNENNINLVSGITSYTSDDDSTETTNS